MTDTALFNVEPIGTVRSDRRRPTDDDWTRVAASIELDSTRFSAESLAGLDAFSHVEVIFLFHKVPPDNVTFGARHPRGRSDWPRVGIFAQRGKERPNRIGLSTCRLLSVSGTRVELAGLDAIDGTPVLDIKPVMAGFEPQGPIREPAWATEIMTGYWVAKD